MTTQAYLLMADSELPRFDATALRSLAEAWGRAAPEACEACRPLACPGWESWPATADAQALQRVGSLRDPAVDDPTLDEHHPAGTHAWDAAAPIAPAFHPYNRCDVWQCRGCGRPFLRYTEYGGYYQDERVRELAAGLIADAQPASN
jgi:hypothetical protein